MDKIKIQDLEVYCNHGVFEEENKLGQKFLISAVLYTDTRRAGRTDDLEQSIHYGEVSHMIDRFMRGHTFQLIERVAEELAKELLQKTRWLQAVDVEVKKPWAPIGLPLKTVSVEISRSWHTSFIALGSNIGERRKYLEEAVQALEDTEDIEVVKVSDYLNTAPYGVTEQEDFLNGCMEIRTLYEPAELLQELHRIEQAAGRERKQRWGPRTLDLDIIFYDDAVIDEEHLTIPHAEMHLRDFVLEPLVQIAPNKRHPLLHKTVKQLYDEVRRK